MRVKATIESKACNVKIKELHRIAQPGEIFEVTTDRFELLSGKNKLHRKFVVPVSDEEFKTVMINTTITETFNPDDVSMEEAEKIVFNVEEKEEDIKTKSSHKKPKIKIVTSEGVQENGSK